MKKTRKSNGKGVQESLDFIIQHMATKEDVREIIKKDVPPIVRGIIKTNVPPIVRAMIIEVVPGIVALEIKPLSENLKHIEKRLNELAEQYANLKGVTKEIDDLRTQLRAVQKHLGIKPPVSAEA